MQVTRIVLAVALVAVSASLCGAKGLAQDNQSRPQPSYERAGSVAATRQLETNNASDREYFLAIINERDRRYDQRFVDSKEAVNTALSAAKEAVNAALIAAKEAVVKAENASEKRFEGVNEFRKTLADQQMTFSRRSDLQALTDNLELRYKTITDRMASLEETVNRNTSRGEGSTATWGYMGAALGVLGTLVGIGGIALRLMGPRPKREDDA